MGVFNSTANKRYNDAVPNYDNEDGIDIVQCNKPSCKFYDADRQRCLFETCVFLLHPLSVPYHTKFTTRCKLCNNTIDYVFDDSNTMNPFTDMNCICDCCINKLKKLVGVDDNEQSNNVQ